jgi:hypothetical protein
LGLKSAVNPLPADFDLSLLVGTELQQVCIDQYQVQLHFEAPGLSCHIQGGGKLLLENGSKSLLLFHGTWHSSAGLERLVGQSVNSWCAHGSHQFRLQFQSGTELAFETQSGPHEDFTIHLGNEAFWVL